MNLYYARRRISNRVALAASLLCAAFGIFFLFWILKDVLLMGLPNRTGALGAVARSLARAGVNIEYSYCTSPLDQSAAALVLSVSDIDAAERTLKKFSGGGK